MRYHLSCALNCSAAQPLAKVGVTLVKNAQLELETAQRDVCHHIAKISTNVRSCVDFVKEENVKTQMDHSHVSVLKALNTTARLKPVSTKTNVTWESVPAETASTTREVSYVNVQKISYCLRTGRIVYRISPVDVTLLSKAVCALHL